MRITLPIVPPTTTAQQKRIAIVNGKPRFFKGKAQAKAERDYLILLGPHRPKVPMAGAVAVGIRFVWPHLAGTAKKYGGLFVPKITRPDVDNSAKNLIDALVTLQFLRDDAQITELTLSKWHGPEGSVSIAITEMER